jgi:hypothetical protein
MSQHEAVLGSQGRDHGRDLRARFAEHGYAIAPEVVGTIHVHKGGLDPFPPRTLR